MIRFRIKGSYLGLFCNYTGMAVAEYMHTHTVSNGRASGKF